MMKMNLQFFAHKKGVGSTKNGRDSESKRLGAKRADGQFVAGFTVRSVKPLHHIRHYSHLFYRTMCGTVIRLN